MNRIGRLVRDVKAGGALLPTGILGVAWVVGPTIFGAGLLWYLGPVSTWLQDQGVFGWVIYVGVFALMSGLGFFPTTAQVVVGGWVFGFFGGISGALLGVAGGGALGFLIARTVSRSTLEDFIDRFQKAKLLRQTLLASGAPRTIFIVALFRMPPHFPFALSNLLISATGVPLRSFLVGSVLGMAPRLSLLAFASAAAAAGGSHDIQEFLREGPGWTVAIVGVVALAIALAILGEIGRRTLAKAVAKTGTEPSNLPLD